MLDSNMAAKVEDVDVVHTFEGLYRIIFTQWIVTAASASLSNYLLTGVTLIGTPISAIQVFTAVFVPAICVSLRQATKTKPSLTLSHLGRGFVLVSVGCLIFHAIAVLFGAPLIDKTEETFHWSILVSVLCILPPCLLLGTDNDTWIKFLAGYWDEPSIESYLFLTGVLTIVGAWLGAIPIPLDWDRPWQAWPITCVIGAISGHIVGLTVSVTRHWIYEKST